MQVKYMNIVCIVWWILALGLYADDPKPDKANKPAPVTIEVGKIVLEADPAEAGKTPRESKSATLTVVEPEKGKLEEPPAEKKPAPPSEPSEPLLPPHRLPQTTPPAIVDDTPAYMLLGEQPYDLAGPPIDPGKRYFARSELLLWWINPQQAPALVTTDVPPGSGFLNSPSRTILYGNGPVGDPFRQGLRITLGWWGDDLQSFGIDGRFFFLGQRTERFFADSRQFPVLVRPFFAANPPIAGENGQFVAYPPGFGRPDYTGNVAVLSNSKLWGAELNIKELLCSGCGKRFGYRFDLFAGYRYLNLDEDLSIREDVTVGLANPAGLPPGTRALVRDDFSTVNQFHGAQLGTTFEARRGPLYFEARFALAMGATIHNLNINGFQLVTQPGQPTQFFAGGLLALPNANIGKYSSTDFSVVPELHCHWGYQLFPRTRIFLGYNFLFWSNVIRPGSEIDRVIDVTKVPNFAPPGILPVVPPRPRPQFNQTGIWAQGIDVGVEFRY